MFKYIFSPSTLTQSPHIDSMAPVFYGLFCKIKTSSLLSLCTHKRKFIAVGSEKKSQHCNDSQSKGVLFSPSINQFWFCSSQHNFTCQNIVHATLNCYSTQHLNQNWMKWCSITQMFQKVFSFFLLEKNVKRKAWREEFPDSMNIKAGISWSTF